MVGCVKDNFGRRCLSEKAAQPGNRRQWGIAAACALVTIVLEAEVALLFIASGAIGVLYHGSLVKSHRRPPTAREEELLC